MSQQYEYHIRTYTAPTPGVTLTPFGSNSLRRCLIVSLNLNATISVVDMAAGSPSGTWARFGLPGIYPLSYRDYGPIIQDAIFVTPSSTLLGLSITEVVLVASRTKGQ